MPLVLAIALGGAAGSVARWWLGTLASTDASFPWATLGINVAGSFLLGVFLRTAALAAGPPELRLALTVGFCGGFTTFSTFSAETLRLLQAGATGRAALYVTASVLLSLAATGAGFVVGQSTPAR